MRMRKKPNLAPRMERCERLLIRDPAAHRGHWRDLKPDAADLRLELGCGKGRFTAETAAQHPDTLYIALERVPDAMVIAMERCMALELTNVFFLDADAAFLRDYFAPGEVDILYINFCDPRALSRPVPRLPAGRRRTAVQDGQPRSVRVVPLSVWKGGLHPGAGDPEPP